MPALANTTQKPMRASYARTLAHLTIGLGISTAASMFAGSAFCQQCDRCAASRSPSCGCELEAKRSFESSPCRCKCVPKPSLGEMLLSHLDRVGDRIEAKAKNSRRSPTCGCESSQSPNCGCESISVHRMSSNEAIQYTPSRMAKPSPFATDPSQFSNGSIGGNHLNGPSAPIVTAPATTQMKTTPDIAFPQSLAPFTPVPGMTVQRMPFEQRNSNAEHNRIPAAETPPANRYHPNAVKAIPSDPPPSWAPKSSSRPVISSPLTPAESKLPDVLVDPFKDDASFRGTRQKMEGVLLTSDRRAQPNGLRLAPPDQGKDAQANPNPIQIERPTRLTPKQRNSPNSQIDAADSAPTESSHVVSLSYLEVAPVRFVVRKELSKDDPTGMPQVPRIKVPSKR